MHDFYARVLVVAKAAPTWLVAASTVLTITADELAGMVGAEHGAVTFVLRVVAWLGVAIAIIRRSTPVLPEARGILPSPNPATRAEAEYLDAYLRHVQ
jgi:hypothetical protein